MKKLLIPLCALLCAACCQKPAEKSVVAVIPQPAEAYLFEGSFDLSGATFSVSPLLGEAAAARVAEFAQNLSLASGKESALVKGKAAISFKYEDDLDPEEYEIEVKKKGIEVEASGLNGCIYAIETLKQLLPVQIYTSEVAPEASWSLQCMKIEDKPRFGYRGVHLDCARHFFSVDEVKKYIDVMVMYKLNRLHWHLTDDQGWRFQVDAYPELTKVGAFRKGTMIGRDWGSCDNVPYGGFYTKDELRDVVAYAAERGVTIVPEIDMPGHMVAALTSYPELGCTGGPYEVWTQWGISDDVLCIGNPKTLEFLDTVFDELCDIFPSEYIHIGGDECPKVRWAQCPKCQAKIAELNIPEDAPYAKEFYLQSYVTKHIEEHLAAKGRKIIGWDEILEGDVSSSATIMSWRGTKGGEEAVKKGHQVIMTPNSYFYIDYYQTANPKANREPLGIGGYVSVNKVYSFEPTTDDMTEEQKDLIIGCQANLWTEYVATNEHLEHMLLPRMCALSEVQWCEKDAKDYERFCSILPHSFDIFDATGYNYAPYFKMHIE